MKSVSTEHFETILKMCDVMELRSQTDSGYLPQFEAARSVNQILQTVESPDTVDFTRIIGILESVNKQPDSYGSLWFDYTIHVIATLRENGYKQ